MEEEENKTLVRTCKPFSKVSGPEKMSAEAMSAELWLLLLFVPSGVWEDSGSVMVKQHFLLVCMASYWARSSFLMDTGPQI